jgi:hypothetical protein
VALDDRFKQAVITALAKRAGTLCSNPDCGALTSGPAHDSSGTVNVGEAAHIYGAHPGSARYDPGMSSAERSAITNGIWLCSNCHKMIDDDPNRFPAGLLFEWLQDHEQRVAERVGKAGAEARRRFAARHMEELGRLSYLAERIISEKGEHWEYRLTTEVLRAEMAPVLRRWSALKRGLYTQSSTRIEKLNTLPWILTRFKEVERITQALSELMNVEFEHAWGAPGVPGEDIEIVNVCRLFAEACKSALQWEESVRFVAIDDAFEEAHSLMAGVAGGLIDEAAKVPAFLTQNLAEVIEPGEYRLTLTLSLPDGWQEAMEAALARASYALLEDLDG